jgi:proteasome accessory factor C
VADTPKRRGPKPAGERLRRLLVMLPWLMERGEVSVSEMATHFAVSEADLVSDLTLASMCGVGPYADEQIELYIDEGVIYPGAPRFFQRPFRLLRHEAFALLAAAEAASTLPGADSRGALGRALRKVSDKLGGAVEVLATAPPFTDAVQDAVRRCEVLDIRYWTASRDELTERSIVPRHVFTEHGDYFVVADDRRSGKERVFRIDRIWDLAATGEYEDPREVAPRQGNWFAEANDVKTAVIRLSADARWVAERYPVRSVVDRPDGGCDVEVTVMSEQWLARLMLRLGPSGAVLSPDDWVGLGAHTAAVLLKRYARR